MATTNDMQQLLEQPSAPALPTQDIPSVYPQQGYPQQGYPQQGYPQQGYPGAGYPQAGLPQSNYTLQAGGGYGTNPGPLIQQEIVSPGRDDTVPIIVTDNDYWAGSSFSDKAIRLRFIRKVYTIVIIQLMFTVAVTLFFCYHEPTKKWVQDRSWLYYPSYAVFLVVYIALMCSKTCRRKWPLNLICLIIFTLALTYMTAMISSTHDTKGVLIALGITVGVSVAVSLFSCQTRATDYFRGPLSIRELPSRLFDFTRCCGTLLALCVALVISGIVFGIWFVSTKNHADKSVWHIVFGCIGGLLASMALAVNTQLLVGSKKNRLSEEEHIFGALQIYLAITDMLRCVLCCMDPGACCTLCC